MCIYTHTHIYTYIHTYAYICTDQSLVRAVVARGRRRLLKVVGVLVDCVVGQVHAEVAQVSAGEAVLLGTDTNLSERWEDGY